MTVFVVVSFRTGSSGSINVEAKKAFQKKEDADAYCAILNEHPLATKWSFVNEVELQ